MGCYRLARPNGADIACHVGPIRRCSADLDGPVRVDGDLITITDGEANPIEWSATAALEMRGLIPRRDKDVFGIGYFHTELSSDFKGTVGSLLSIAATLKNRTLTRIAIEDTDGFEAYYKAQVTPWFALTGDLQVITETLSPARGQRLHFKIGIVTLAGVSHMNLV